MRGIIIFSLFHSVWIYTKDCAHRTIENTVDREKQGEKLKKINKNKTMKKKK